MHWMSAIARETGLRVTFPFGAIRTHDTDFERAERLVGLVALVAPHLIPGALAATAVSHAVHPVVPVTRAKERQPVRT